MNGTRFARSGRYRLFAALLALVLMFSMVAVFHNSQQQLEETREQRMRCEQQQESLNLRLQSVIEQKFNMEKAYERDRKELLEAQKNLEQKLKIQQERNLKEEMESRVKYDQLQHNLKHLQNEHTASISECSKTTKRYNEKVDSLEKQLQTIRSELQKERNKRSADIKQWKDKYESVLREKDNLEGLMNSSDSQLTPLQERIRHLEKIIAEQNPRNENQSKSQRDSPQQINKPLIAPQINKTEKLKSFGEQQLVSPDLYIIPIRTTNRTFSALTVKPISYENGDRKKSNSVAQSNLLTTMKMNFDGVGNKSIMNESNTVVQKIIPSHNHSLFIHSVENFQILPKPINVIREDGGDGVSGSIQRKLQTDTLQGRSASPLVSPLERIANVSQDKKVNVSISLRPTSVAKTGVTPSASSQFQNLRKLPDNVAPIPENFDELLKNEPNEVLSSKKLTNLADAADIDAAAEDIQKNDVDDNRYANVVNELDQGAKIKSPNEDSGAHEIKDRDFVNYPNMNFPIEDNNFIDGGNKKDNSLKNKRKLKANDENIDEMLGAGGGANADLGDDIAVAGNNHNLFGGEESVNNEVIRDQGKEFDDGINLEDGNDDGDEDDYSNLEARQQGAHAIRH